MVTDFWRESAKLAYPPFIPCAGIPRRMVDRNMDVRVITVDDLSTSVKNWRSSSPLNFAGAFAPDELHAWVIIV